MWWSGKQAPDDGVKGSDGILSYLNEGIELIEACTRRSWDS
jgi:hypothetical protein